MRWSAATRRRRAAGSTPTMRTSEACPPRACDRSKDSSMSSTIWTQCAGSSEIRPLATTPWRAVESQHQVATRKLVDSDAEQAILEDVLERYKPPLPDGSRLHYLLFTP